MSEKNEYRGQPMVSIILGLSDSKNLVQKLLHDAGVEEIDPDAWYDYDWAMNLLYEIEKQVGSAALREVGRKVIEIAELPPDINDVYALLMAIDPWFKIYARGPTIGGVICSFPDDHSAILDYTAKGPCSFCLGIVEGACRRFGVKPLIEHGSNECKDRGDERCIYHLSW